MAKNVAFDTLVFAERLKAGGFTEQLAKAATLAFADAIGEQLATKADIDALGQATRADIATLRQSTKSDVDSLRQDLRMSEAKLTAEILVLKWMCGVIVAGTLAILLKSFFP